MNEGPESSPNERWKRATEMVIAAQSRTSYREHIEISMTEHVDVRLECRSDELGNLEVVSPRIDGRLKDVAKS